MVPLNVRDIYSAYIILLCSKKVSESATKSCSEEKGKCHFLYYNVEFRLRKNEIITSESTFYIAQLPFWKWFLLWVEYLCSYSPQNIHLPNASTTATLFYGKNFCLYSYILPAHNIEPLIFLFEVNIRFQDRIHLQNWL